MIEHLLMDEVKNLLFRKVQLFISLNMEFLMIVELKVNLSK